MKKSQLVLVLVFVLAAGGTAGGRIIYVDANAPGPAHDGSSWANAYNCLQDALAYARPNPDVNEIRVAQGTYRPDEDTAHPNGTGERTATFQLKSGVAIRGGYAGYGEAEPTDRDVKLYQTILSGDLDENDIEVSDPCDLLTESTHSENSYHVVTAGNTDATAVLAATPRFVNVLTE